MLALHAAHSEEEDARPRRRRLDGRTGQQDLRQFAQLTQTVAHDGLSGCTQGIERHVVACAELQLDELWRVDRPSYAADEDTCCLGDFGALLHERSSDPVRSNAVRLADVHRGVLAGGSLE